ncbi:MAG TPA: TIGR03435 family protein [Bryobacteraceae bacterium]|nr:TIGR03435 family protein [Bryobacteraceae bacterium]
MIRPLILGITIALLAGAQSFEVVSIKLNQSGDIGGGMGPRGGRFRATNINLSGLVQYAYSPAGHSLLDAQVVGLPIWARTDRYDIEAKPPDGAPVGGGEQTRAMMRSLLEDRFHLKFHRETIDLPVYNLVTTKNGPVLPADQTPPDPRQTFITFATEGSPLSPLPRGALRMVAGPNTTVLTGEAISVPRLVQLLQGRSDRIIIDKSGFTGLLDVQLTFGQDPAGEDPALFTAIQEIGLKLQSAKAPVEVVVVDRVERPRPN